MNNAWILAILAEWLKWLVKIFVLIVIAFIVIKLTGIDRFSGGLFVGIFAPKFPLGD